jgi:hypothetical protein
VSLPIIHLFPQASCFLCLVPPAVYYGCDVPLFCVNLRPDDCAPPWLSFTHRVDWCKRFLRFNNKYSWSSRASTLGAP